MSMTLPRWFGRKSKRKDDNKGPKLEKNEKHVEISTSDRPNDSTKYLTIHPNYESNKDKCNVKAFSAFKLTSNELYEVEKQSKTKLAMRHKEIVSKNGNHFQNAHTVSLDNRTDEYSSIGGEITHESHAIYGGR